MSLRHNEVCDITAKMLSEVCKDVRTEPLLCELTNENFAHTSANLSKEARLDISALGFWIPGQRVFCDVRVFDPNALRYRETEIKRCYEKNEQEKKRSYNERVLEVEHGSFTPLVFATHGGMGRECRRFYQRLSEMIADKRDIAPSVATTFVRTKISFSLLRSTLLCLRGSRSIRRNIDMDVDISLTNSLSEIRDEY